MPDDDLQRFFADLATHAGTAPINPAEAQAVLDLARVVAHGSQRRYAPVAAYAAGLAIGVGTDPDQRAERLRAVTAAVQQQADDASASP